MATFIAISRLVTGFSKLDPDLAHVYADLMAASAFWAAEFTALEQAVDVAVATADPETALAQAMAQEPAVAAAARRLAHLWYAGRLPAENGVDAPFVSETAYFSSLIWLVARAHPPGLSGGYTGHWRYAPDV